MLAFTREEKYRIPNRTWTRRHTLLRSISIAVCDCAMGFLALSSLGVFNPSSCALDPMLSLIENMVFFYVAVASWAYVMIVHLCFSVGPLCNIFGRGCWLGLTCSFMHIYYKHFTEVCWQNCMIVLARPSTIILSKVGC